MSEISTSILLLLSGISLAFVVTITIGFLKANVEIKRLTAKKGELNSEIEKLLNKQEAIQNKIHTKQNELILADAQPFYYLDEKQSLDIYNQIFQELEIPKRIETIESKKIGSGYKAKLFTILGANYADSEETHTKKTYEAKTPLETLYKKVEKYLSENAIVAFGCEEFEYDETLINDFQLMCKQIYDKFGYNIPGEYQKSFLDDKIKAFARDKITELSMLRGYIAVQADFSILSGTDGVYFLSFDHPVNNYIVDDGIKTYIQVVCNKDFLRPAGLSVFTSSNSVRATCFGRVITWKPDVRTLLINPIALY